MASQLPSRQCLEAQFGAQLRALLEVRRQAGQREPYRVLLAAARDPERRGNQIRIWPLLYGVIWCSEPLKRGEHAGQRRWRAVLEPAGSLTDLEWVTSGAVLPAETGAAWGMPQEATAWALPCEALRAFFHHLVGILDDAPALAEEYE